MFEALVVSVVAELANAVPFVLVTVTAPVVVLIVASPLAVKPPNDPALSYWIWPEVPPGKVALAEETDSIEYQFDGDDAQYVRPLPAARDTDKFAVPALIVPPIGG